MGRLRTLAACLLILAGALAWPHRARGDDTADEAEFRFRRGAELYAKHQYAGALEEFFASNRLVHNHNVVFNIGRCLEQLGQVNVAYRYYAGLLDEKLPPADRREVEQSLRRLSARVALVRVETEPPGATIYVERRDLGALGQTPRTLALPPGKTKLVLDLAGYDPAQAEATLGVGQEKPVRLALRRILGAVAFEVEPASAEVRLDREDGQRVEGGEPKLVPGRHTFWVSAPGFVAQGVDLDVLPEQRVPLRVRLSPAPTPSGALVVRANIDGALVKVDGKEMGFTPGVIEPVAAGLHEVTLSAVGRETWKGEVGVKANARSFVDVRLHYAAPDVEAATKTLARASDAPASIAVITRDEIRAFGYQTLAEAMRAVRGAYLSDDRTYTYLGFRGFSPLGDYNTRVLILVDGHAVYDPWVNQSYIDRGLDVDLADVDRIEVVRGPGSALYGAGAVFGVINVVHRAAAPGAQVEAETGLGSLGANQGRVSGSTAAKGASVAASAAAYDATGEPVYASPLPNGGQALASNQDGERAYHADLRARLGDFRLNAMVNSRRRVTPTAPYGYLFGEPLTSVDGIGYAEGRYDHGFASGAAAAARAYYDGSRYRGDYFTPGVAPGAADSNQDLGGADAVGGELRVRLPEWARNRLTLGTEAQDRLRIYQSVATGGAYKLDETRQEQVLSAYLNDDVALLRWLVLTGGVRVDDHVGSFGVAVDPRLAVVAHPYEGASTKLLFGRAFRAPSIYERFYEDGVTQIAAHSLQPEIVYSGELEHTHPLSDEIALTGAVFYDDISQLIELGTDPATQELVYVNQPGHVRAYGAEAELRYQPSRSLLLDASYAYQHSRDQAGQLLVNSPAHVGALRAMVPIVPEVLVGSTEAVYNSPRLIAQPGARAPGPVPRVGESLVWNVTLSGEYARYRLTYSAGVYNLLDQRYALPAQGLPLGVTQYGRTLRLGAGVRF